MVEQMAQRSAFDLGLWPRVLNVGLLIGGFGIGQGAIFAVQTWLVAQGEFVLLAQFGAHFSFAVLGTLFVDAGSITVLARHVAHLSGKPGAREEISRIFWETSAFRVFLALLIVLGGAIYALTIATEEFPRAYVLSALPGFLIWACNAAGLLDGHKRSGLSGITGSIAYIASAVALVFARHDSPAVAGAMLGAAFSIGNLATVVAQWAVLARHGWMPGFSRISSTGTIRSCKNGLAMLCGILPGQLYFRFQIVLSQAFLGPEQTAMLLYAKQIVAAATQIIGFVLRVEFPGLVQRFSRPAEQNFRTIFDSQKFALYLAVAATFAVLAMGVLMRLGHDEHFNKVALLICASAPTILTLSILWIISQPLAALSRFTLLSLIIVVFVLVGVAVSYLLLASYGVYAFIAGDIASHATGAVLLYFCLRDPKSVDPLASVQRP
jgi:O-antigen/teichoic acid export membrane protein